jgi:hypothetical protein
MLYILPMFLLRLSQCMCFNKTLILQQGSAANCKLRGLLSRDETVQECDATKDHQR